MSNRYQFHTKTAMAKGLKQILAALADRLEISRSVNVYLAGGMAVHLYTGTRVTTDVDAEFGARILLPNDLMVEVELEDGARRSIYLDTNYNSTFALMHEDYIEDSIPVDLGLSTFNVRVLSPVDLAVSKLVRFAPNDREDIAALVALGLTTASEIERRATSALVGYIGSPNFLKINIRDAIALARSFEPKPAAQPEEPVMRRRKP